MWTDAIGTGASWGFLALIVASGLGLPIPAPPLLMAAGVLVGTGGAHLSTMLAVSVVALLVGDLLWYHLGRWQGSRILRLLCRLSLEPESCVQRTGELFSSHETFALVGSKFLPGLKAVAPPLAGMLRIPLLRFMLLDLAGTTLWAASFIGLGYVFSEQVARAARPVALVGEWLFLTAVAALAGWIGWKEILRRRTLRRLAIARVTPQELRAMLDGENVLVVDLRNSIESATGKVPGALRIDAADLERRQAEIARDRDVVIYCDCPNEAAAARMALLLRQRGVTRVRPLLGGIEAWRQLGYPLEPAIA